MGKNFPKRGLQRTDGHESRVEGLERTRGHEMIVRQGSRFVSKCLFLRGNTGTLCKSKNKQTSQLDKEITKLS